MNFKNTNMSKRIHSNNKTKLMNYENKCILNVLTKPQERGFNHIYRSLFFFYISV